MSIGNVIRSTLYAIKYKRDEVRFLYVMLFFLAIFENFSIGANFCLADLIYLVFLLYFALKSLRIPFKRASSFYWFPFSFLVIAIIDYEMFHANKMLFSQLRFVFNCSVFAVLASYLSRLPNTEKSIVTSSYVYVSTIASFFIILQFLSFHILHYNLNFDFGAFQGSINAASLAVPGSSLYRTGGFFKEPSWYAVFMGPVLDIAYKKGKITELVICILGLVLSTSSMGFIFLFVFFILNLKNNRKYVLLFVFLVYIVYVVFPSAFERLFVALDFSEGADNSNESRVIGPFTYIFTGGTFPVLGMNIEDLYIMYDEKLFLNTFLFVLMSFGVVGIIIFAKMLWQKTSIYITTILLITVIIEGCYGRIDFWMPLLAATVFNKNMVLNNYGK